MGYPLRSNIFVKGTDANSYFDSFPLQIFVLFSPDDKEFLDYFKDAFLKFDLLTGKSIAFFSILDPPNDWLMSAKERKWWVEYQERTGRSTFSFFDRPLMMEIARLFGVDWENLPVLVVSTNLRDEKQIVLPTSKNTMEAQFEILKNIIKGNENINIKELKKILREEAGIIPRQNKNLLILHQLYSMTKTLELIDDSIKINKSDFGRIASREVQRSMNLLFEARRLHYDNINIINEEQKYEHISFEDTDDPKVTFIEKKIEDIKGGLVPLATVAEKLYQGLLDSEKINLDLLESKSRTMIETAVRVGKVLEQERIGCFNSMPQTAEDIDFSPGALDLWKAFENEINYSFIQVARKSRTIAMPDYFATHCPNVSKKTTLIKTMSQNGKTNKSHDINRKDYSQNSRQNHHKFLTLGDAFYVCKMLSDSPKEQFNQIIAECLGRNNLTNEFSAWEKIHKIRNKGSHTDIISRQEYEIVLQNVLNPDILEIFLRIKKALSHK